MAKKRVNGEGSIRKRSDGCWEGRYTTGRDPATGKPIYKNVLGKTQSEAKESGVFELYYIELATGLRRGELLGLRWEDVDLEQGVIRVRRQVTRIDGRVVEAPLKTKNAYRTLSIGADAVGILNGQKEKHRDSGYVFPSPSGEPISPGSSAGGKKHVENLL